MCQFQVPDEPVGPEEGIMMSRDEPWIPALPGTDGTPGPGGPASMTGRAEDRNLRYQVLELIKDILTDPDPEGEWARTQLRKQLASHPDHPEKALLAHLAGTRKPHAGQHPLPAPRGMVPLTVSAGIPDKDGPAGAAQRIRSVLESRLLLTAFQPVQVLPEGRVAGLEALTRFISSDRTADTWFRETEATGVSLELELAALQCALSAAATVPAHLFVAFNLSPATFTLQRVQDLLQRSALAMDRIIIELRGQTDERLWSKLICIAKPLRRQGLRIAVDGSGNGFIPAERIRSLRPDIIKLDRSFIDGIVGSQDAEEPAVIRLAREIGAVLAGEGIETEGELAAVVAAGMTAGQGYLLGRSSAHPLDWSSWVIETTAGSSGEPGVRKAARRDGRKLL